MRLALRFVPVVLIGGLAALLLVGPLAHLYASPPPARQSPQPSAAPSGSVTTLPGSGGATGIDQVRCPLPARPVTAPPGTPAPVAPALPVKIWVNDPLGVNVRAAPDIRSARLDTLSQGTAATAFERTTDGSGALWYHMSRPDDDRLGWVMGAFVVTHPISRAGADGWQAMLPAGYRMLKLGPGNTEVQGQGESPYPFLRVRTEFTNGGIAPPAGIRWDAAPIFDHTEQIQVWNFTVQKYVTRIPLDTCTVAAASERRDAGWPYRTVLLVRAPSRSYEFTFLTEEPDSPVVAQVLASALLS